MTAHDQATRALRGRITFALSLKYALRAMVAVSFTFGLAVLVARVAAGFGAGAARGQLALAAGAGASALMLAGLAGVAYALRRRPAMSVVRAVIDRQARAGGLVMASEETDVGAWSTRIAAHAVPGVRYRNPRSWCMLLAGLVFAGVALLVPDAYTRPAAAGALDVSDQAGLLADQIRVLEEEQVLDADEAAVMRDKLAQVQREASGSDPAKTFESLDHMGERLDNAADLAAEQAAGSAEQLTEAEALAEALAEDGQAMDPERAAGAMGELTDMLRQAALQNRAFAEALDEQTLERIEAGAKPEAHFDLDIERAQELAELGDEMRRLAEKLEATDPNAVSPLDAAQLAELQRKLTQLSEEERQQLEALAKAAAELAKLGIDAIVEIDILGVADFYVPDAQVKLADLQDPNARGRFAAKLPEGRPTFRGVDASKGFAIPPEALNGEAIALTRNEQGKLTVFGHKPSFKLAWDKVDELDATYFVATGGGEPARVYGPDDGGRFDPGALGGACKLARAVKADQLRALRRMQQAKLITPEQLKQAQQNGQLDAEAIAALKQMLAEGRSAKQAAAAACNQPGRGGISRGRGDAPMTWKDPTTDDGAKFTEQVLPPASLSQLKDSESVGVSVGAPELADPTAAHAGGALSGRETGDSSAQTQAVLPRHRGAVKRYFERQ